ncbi:site-specific integrase [Acinetobacter pittii]|uniref:tyrosine-type recombinase/integrase n=1 Tax=Acinetobacter pittii TaxID=48296 RepID=UPI002A69C116|nr:site-specific integrase [Acinetobacter pittii]WPP56422.1 site-specific integrase [Acinetobacter pittii]
MWHSKKFKAQQSNSCNKQKFVQGFVQNIIAGMEGKLLKIFCKLVFYDVKMALSDTWLKSNNGKLREATQVINDRDGLSVRISPKGKIVFQMRYRFNNSSKRMDIGTYPMMSLKEARAEVLENKKELDKGRDPLQLKLKKETAYLAQPTVRQICLEFFETAAAHKAACKDDKRAFELHVFPRLGKRICDEVTLQEWSQLLFTIVSYAKTVAIKVLGNLKLIMKWGCIHGKLKEQTLLHIRAIDLNVRKNPRTRYLTEQEIFWVIHATFLSTGISPKNKLMILMLLIFGCRVGELRTAKKSDFDFQNHTWTIPPEQHKTGARSRKAIVRPMIPQVEVLIKQAFELSPPDCEWAFPIIRAKKYKPTQKGFQTTIPIYINENVKRYFDVDINHWTTHDLRRTMRTHIAEFAPPHICEIMLGHALPQVWGTYDLNQYLEPQAQAYAKWFDKLCAIINNYERFDIKGSISSDSKYPFLLSQDATALTPYKLVALP